MIKNRELKSISEEELKKRIGELKQELIKINAQVATGTTPKNPGQIKQMRRTIARIKTILKNKVDKKA